MRSFVFALLVLFTGTRAAHAEVAPAAAKVARKLTKAVDDDDAKTFLALMPAKVTVAQVRRSKSWLKRAIKKASIADVFSLPTSGEWILEDHDGAVYLYRVHSDADFHGGQATVEWQVGFELVRRKARWIVRDTFLREICLQSCPDQTSGLDDRDTVPLQ